MFIRRRTLFRYRLDGVFDEGGVPILADDDVAGLAPIRWDQRIQLERLTVNFQG